MQVTIEDQDGAVVVTATGEIDLFTASLLHTALERALADTAAVVVVDLSAVTFLSSSGLNALVCARRDAEAGARALRLIGEGRAVTRPMQAAGLTEHFSWFPDVMTAAGRTVA